jgi:hypothetical protein
MHVYGILDEAVAECYGMQLMAYFMYRMGNDPAIAIEAAIDYATALYETVNPPEYLSPECRPGGDLDLQPERPEWPVIMATPAARRLVPGATVRLPAPATLPRGGVPAAVADGRVRAR